MPEPPRPPQQLLPDDSSPIPPLRTDGPADAPTGGGSILSSSPDISPFGESAEQKERREQAEEAARAGGQNGGRQNAAGGNPPSEAVGPERDPYDADMQRFVDAGDLEGLDQYVRETWDQFDDDPAAEAVEAVEAERFRLLNSAARAISQITGESYSIEQYWIYRRQRLTLSESSGERNLAEAVKNMFIREDQFSGDELEGEDLRGEKEIAEDAARESKTTAIEPPPPFVGPPAATGLGLSPEWPMTGIGETEEARKRREEAQGKPPEPVKKPDTPVEKKPETPAPISLGTGGIVGDIAIVMQPDGGLVGIGAGGMVQLSAGGGGGLERVELTPELRARFDAAIASGDLPAYAGTTAPTAGRDGLRTSLQGTHDIATAAESLVKEGLIVYDQATAQGIAGLLDDAGFGNQKATIDPLKNELAVSFYGAASRPMVLYTTRMNCHEFVNLAGFIADDEGAIPSSNFGTRQMIDESTLVEWDGTSEIPRGKVVIGYVDGKVKRWWTDVEDDNKTGEIHYGISLGDGKVASNHGSGPAIESMGSVFGIGWFGYTRVVYGDYVGHKPKAVAEPVITTAVISDNKSPLISQQLGTRMKATTAGAGAIAAVITIAVGFALLGGGNNSNAQGASSVSASPTSAAAAVQSTAQTAPTSVAVVQPTQPPPSPATATPQPVVSAPPTTQPAVAPPQPTVAPPTPVPPPPPPQTITSTGVFTNIQQSATGPLCTDEIRARNGTNNPGQGTYTLTRTATGTYNVTSTSGLVGVLNAATRTMTVAATDAPPQGLTGQQRTSTLVYNAAGDNSTVRSTLTYIRNADTCVIEYAGSAVWTPPVVFAP